MNLREATPADIPVLAKHRRLMFDDMIVHQPVGYTQADADAMEAPYAAYLRLHLGGVLRAWVIESEGKVIASGGLLINSWPPRPGDHSGQSALLYSVYTDPPYRRQGLARQIMQALLDECRRRELRTVNLHASDAGRPMYEAMGFTHTSEMRLLLR